MLKLIFSKFQKFKVTRRMWQAYLLLVFWGYRSQEAGAFIPNPVPMGPSRASPSVNINAAYGHGLPGNCTAKACAGQRWTGWQKSNDMCQRSVKQESNGNFAPLSHKNFNEQFPGLLQKWPLVLQTHNICNQSILSDFDTLQKRLLKKLQS